MTSLTIPCKNIEKEIYYDNNQKNDPFFELIDIVWAMPEIALVSIYTQVIYTIVWIAKKVFINPNLVATWKKHAMQLNAVHVDYRFNEISQTTLFKSIHYLHTGITIIVPAMNIPQLRLLNREGQSVIKSSLINSLESLEFRTTYDLPIDIVDLTKKKEEELPFNSDGLCFGISLEFIRILLSNADELNSADLICVAKKFEKGGSEDANALQYLHASIHNYKSESAKRKIEFQQCNLKKLKEEQNSLLEENQSYIDIVKYVQDKKSLTIPVCNSKFLFDSKEEFFEIDKSDKNKIKVDLSKIKSNLLKLSGRLEELDTTRKQLSKESEEVQNKTQDFQLDSFAPLAALIGVQLSPTIHDAITPNDILNLPKGVYEMNSYDHSMVFVKTQDSAYIFDSNNGLMTATFKTIKFIASEYLKTGQKFKFNRCELAPKK